MDLKKTQKICVTTVPLRARSSVVKELDSKAKGSEFESSTGLREDVSSLPYSPS